jgi:TonB-linked SusC/RagA family outer membrane protein
MRKLVTAMVLLLCIAHSFAQTHLITGTIRNHENQPVPNATVTALKNKTTVTTNNKGQFSITLTILPDSLQISHITYQSQSVSITVNSGTVLTFRLLPSALSLEEVTINTGYQKIPKERSTGSFTQLNKELLNEQVGTNITERLKYITNGAVAAAGRIGGSTGGQILIRGISTLTLTIQKPLIIVDNFEYNGDIENINPNDVENVTFLKDAAAGSIWGAKAANGVIVITTKKGKLKQPMKLELNSNITVVQEPDLFYYPLMSTGDYIDMEKFLFGKGYYNTFLNFPKFYSASPVVKVLQQQRQGTITQAEADKLIDAYRPLDLRNEFAKHFYSPALNQQYALTLSGGSLNHAWILSAGYDKNKSELSALYDRYTVRLENTYRPFNKLELTAGMYMVQTKLETGKPGYGQITSRNGDLTPYTTFTNSDGSPAPLYLDYYDKSYIDTAGAGLLYDWRYYPTENYKHSKTTQHAFNVNATAGLSYKPFSFLSFNLNYRYQAQFGKNLFSQGLGSYYTRDLINSYAQINYATKIVTWRVPPGGILDETNNRITAQNLRGIIEFNKQWKQHVVNAIAGAEASAALTESSMFRTYGYNPDVLTRANIDPTVTYPHFVLGSRSFIPNPASFGKGAHHMLSFFGNAAYTYLNRYTLSASARRDASNVFGLNTNDKWKPLWSAGFAWNIAQEKFYRVNWLPVLKLRITYGKQGNLDPSKVAGTTVSYVGTNPFTLTPYGFINNYLNPDLKWEETAMLNTGVDFAVKNNRISGSVEYYHKRITDLYGRQVIDPTAGVGASIIKNVASVQGHGVDLQLNSVNVKQAIVWTTNFIINFYKDKVTKNLPLPAKGSQFVGGGFTPVEGYSPFAYFAFKWAGLDAATGDPMGYIDGQPSKNYNLLINEVKSIDLKYVGSYLPWLFGSVGNTVSWKGLSLTARVTYKFGYYFRRESIRFNNLVTQARGHGDYALRWQKPGDEKITSVPSFVYPSNTQRDNFYLLSEALATKGDHIRLQYININYQLSKHKLPKLPFEQVNVYAVLNNVGILWRANKNKLDPDFPNLPAGRSFATGIRIGF